MAGMYNVEGVMEVMNVQQEEAYTSQIFLSFRRWVSRETGAYKAENPVHVNDPKLARTLTVSVGHHLKAFDTGYHILNIPLGRLSSSSSYSQMSSMLIAYIRWEMCVVYKLPDPSRGPDGMFCMHEGTNLIETP